MAWSAPLSVAVDAAGFVSFEPTAQGAAPGSDVAVYSAMCQQWRDQQRHRRATSAAGGASVMARAEWCPPRTRSSWTKAAVDDENRASIAIYDCEVPVPAPGPPVGGLVGAGALAPSWVNLSKRDPRDGAPSMMVGAAAGQPARLTRQQKAVCSIANSRAADWANTWDESITTNRTRKTRSRADAAIHHRLASRGCNPVDGGPGGGLVAERAHERWAHKRWLHEQSGRHKTMGVAPDLAGLGGSRFDISG